MTAGLSSRFGGMIIQFAEIGPNEEPLIEYSMNQAIKAGISKIVFIVGDLTKKPFQEKFSSSYKNIKIEYTFQTYDKKERDKPWGTLDAISTIKNNVNCPFIICNGDDIYGENSFKTLVNHLKNVYRVLMSRAHKGVYVYFMDKDTEKYFRTHLPEIK